MPLVDLAEEGEPPLHNHSANRYCCGVGMERPLESKPLSYYALCALSFLTLVGGGIAILIGVNTEMPTYYSSATNSSYYAEIAAEALAKKRNFITYGTYGAFAGAMLMGFAAVVGMLSAILHAIRSNNAPVAQATAATEVVS